MMSSKGSPIQFHLRVKVTVSPYNHRTRVLYPIVVCSDRLTKGQHRELCSLCLGCFGSCPRNPQPETTVTLVGSTAFGVQGPLGIRGVSLGGISFFLLVTRDTPRGSHCLDTYPFGLPGQDEGNQGALKTPNWWPWE